MTKKGGSGRTPLFLTKCQEKKEEPLTMLTPWDTVFLSFGSFSLFLRPKRKKMNKRFQRKDWIASLQAFHNAEEAKDDKKISF